ncbi:GNAT family N-acetyltransferase [Actinoplanes flavus]|uniref:GNAT family N-acetyltransferase n=1 Tax=Actinoplanes flavus TaxID=2820290 RepID=A0ABS3UV07_9ACTN|nr:GNAT family N-acetyltransferase [Actinoplanes flavus]MBO3742377.1 GNAT family N-acetyltransferase [Actinoplanes flavus]
MIRLRRPEDLERCVAALRAVHEADRYPLNWPADPLRWLAPEIELCSWVATGVDGAVLGHVAVHRDAELSRLFVVPAARRRSLAGRLVGAVRQWAAVHGRTLTLNVVDDERRAGPAAFYEATGWRHTHTVVADWTGPDGSPVRLRYYTIEPDR